MSGGLLEGNPPADLRTRSWTDPNASTVGHGGRLRQILPISTRRGITQLTAVIRQPKGQCKHIWVGSLQASSWFLSN